MSATSDPPVRADGRRELGQRTRARILQATSELLAERGEDAIRLRDITGAAQVNIAAVNYHFGSLQALCITATRDAVQTILAETTRELANLDVDASLERIVAAWARPVLDARSGPSCTQRQAFLRITARAGSHPPEELCEWLTEVRSDYQCQLVGRLRRALPHVPEDELRFRVRCAAGILDTLSTPTMQTELRDTDAEELQQLLIPVIAGALSGSRAPARLARPARRAPTPDADGASRPLETAQD